MCRMCHDLEQEMKQSSSVSTMMASFGWRVWKNCERKCAKSGASLAMLTRRRREVWRNESWICMNLHLSSLSRCFRMQSSIFKTCSCWGLQCKTCMVFKSSCLCFSGLRLVYRGTKWFARLVASVHTVLHTCRQIRWQLLVVFCSNDRGISCKMGVVEVAGARQVLQGSGGCSDEKGYNPRSGSEAKKWCWCDVKIRDSRRENLWVV